MEKCSTLLYPSPSKFLRAFRGAAGLVLGPTPRGFCARLRTRCSRHVVGLQNRTRARRYSETTFQTAAQNPTSSTRADSDRLSDEVLKHNSTPPSGYSQWRGPSASGAAEDSGWPIELAWRREKSDRWEAGGGGRSPPGGEAATTQARPQASLSSPPTFPPRGVGCFPIATLSPPPSTSGHVPLAARATHVPALNLCPPGAKLEAGAARAARTPGGGERRKGVRARGRGSAHDDLLSRLPAGQLSSRPAARPRLGGDGGGRRHLGQGQPRELAGCGSRPDGGFHPSRVVVVAKTTRYEFEQQRYRYAELSEEDLKQLVGPGAALLRSRAWPVL
ncbi:hypothetical protein P7K49_004629 [Saguinus oedipus]|uniref:Uncharacterized protein n=1 Tax=Saguinus oedipus TaxID=9490 RepID=A0ABQ9WBH8_SAGOE|nr:hypothetical protein P7K49_004629 [Saguinus oedipus]